MSGDVAARPSWDGGSDGVRAIALNVATRYLAILVEAALGFLMLPFNMGHLGKPVYGLWVLAASVTAYFSVLDLGYAGALTRFVAHYRARRDAQAINELLSTLFFLFTAVGVAVMAAAVFAGSRLGAWFHLSPQDAAVGRTILLIVSLQVASGFTFSVFGSVVNGFQRYDLNNLVGAATALLVALVNVSVLLLGFGVVPLVVATTAVRLTAYLAYRRNAYRVFPALRISAALVRRARLREVTGFSLFMAVLDWAAKVNYALDVFVVGASLGTVAVAVWTVSQRLLEAVQRLTSQLSDVLFPTVVDCDADRDDARLRDVLIQGTRLSLATALPAAVAVALLALPILTAWVGASQGNVDVTRLLAAVVVFRVGSATAMTLLKGAGRHRLLAACNGATAIANLSLSLALVGPLGLPGVALGTLVPVGLATVLLIVPAACRRAGLDIASLLRQAVWPTIWPTIGMAAWLGVAERWAGPSLPLLAVHCAAAGLVYLVLFARWGLPQRERRVYAAKVAAFLSRRRRLEATT